MIKLSDINPIPPNWVKFFYSLIDPIVRAASKLNVHPNTFTSLGFVLSAVATYFAMTGHLRVAAVIILAAGLCDALDGRLARESGKATRFGALFDSTLDRYSEVLFLFGLAYYFITNDWSLTAVAVAIALGGSLMVSYVRARSEGLGFECKVGLLQRPERLLLLGGGGLIHVYTLVAAIWIVAVFSNVTAIQRIVHVWKQDREQKNPEAF